MNLFLWCPDGLPDIKILYFTLDTYEPTHIIGVNQPVAGLIREYCLRNGITCEAVEFEDLRKRDVDLVVSFEKDNNELLAFARNISIPMVEVFKQGDFYITSVR